MPTYMIYELNCIYPQTLYACMLLDTPSSILDVNNEIIHIFLRINICWIAISCLNTRLLGYMFKDLQKDVASVSDISTCIKIDKPPVVYRFW